MSYLPLFALIIPFLGAFFIYLFGQESKKFRNFLAVLVSALTFLVVLLMYWPVIIGGKPIKTFLPSVFPVSLLVDPLGLLFATITTFVWLLVVIYSVNYMEGEHKLTRYYTLLPLLLSANLGVVLSGNLISLFFFFESLSLLAYFVVIHEETEKALQAGIKYIWMMVFGGTFLLAGIFLFYGYTRSVDLQPSLSSLATLGNIKYLIAGLMILGFGVKAGMIPVHTWLPDAHSAAPSPASALLSGVIIKAGAYGILRVIGTLFRPSFGIETWGSHLLRITASIGYVVIWIGIITMFIGVIMALLQENSKKMLAYHSISQMGYILMGIGLAGYLAQEGALGFAGSIYHLVNHALFKAALFLGIGAVYYRTKELNMYKLGGLWKKMPLAFLFTLIAALGISGIPLFNGFISKTLLHEAILESAHRVHLPALRLAEIVFLITGAGTLCSFMKLITYTFLGKTSPKYEKIEDAPLLMNISLGILALAIIILGLFPQLFLKFFLNPVFKYWGLPMRNLGYSFFFSLESLKGTFISISLGGFIFIIGAKYGLFHLQFPDWFGVDYWYGKAAQGFLHLVLEDIVAFKRFVRQALIFLLGGDRFVWQEEINRKILTPLLDKLEEERLSIVRTVIKKMSMKLRREELSSSEWPERMNEIRNMANYLALRVMEERLAIIKAEISKVRTEVIRDTILTKGIRESLDKLEIISQGISEIEMKLRKNEANNLMIESKAVSEIQVKPMVGATTLGGEMERILMEGEGVKISLEEIKESMREIVIQDRIDSFEATIQKATSGYRAALKEYRKAQQAISVKVRAAKSYWLKANSQGKKAQQAVSTKVRRWLHFMVCIIEGLLKKKVSWSLEGLMSQEEISQIRLAIKASITEYDRDITVGVLLFMTIFILIVGLLLVRQLFQFLPL